MENVCIGCGDQLVGRPEVFAIMHVRDISELGEVGANATKVEGAGKFHAAAVCSACHADPAHRKVTLKAHFAPRVDVERMLGRAGSSSIG